MMQEPMLAQFEDAEMAQLWEGLADHAGQDMTMDLVPLSDAMGEQIHRSPTVYSSASDTSLCGGRGMAWRMYVPEEEGDTMEELLLHSMTLDVQNVTMQARGPDDGVLTAINAGGKSEGKEDVPVQGDAARGFLTTTGGRLEIARENRPMLLYKAEALAQLQIVPTTSVKTTGVGGGLGGVMNWEGEGKADETQSEGPSAHRELLAEIDRVMARVDEAMGDLEDSEGNKRVRRTLQTSSNEVRTLVRCLDNDEAGEVVEGARVEENKMILLIASESSEESGERKRKRKERNRAKAGSVASRLRKKNLGKTAVGSDEGEPAKVQKMAVRKVKASAKKPCTSLTLAPPTLGLANE